MQARRINRVIADANIYLIICVDCNSVAFGADSSNSSSHMRQRSADRDADDTMPGGRPLDGGDAQTGARGRRAGRPAEWGRYDSDDGGGGGEENTRRKTDVVHFRQSSYLTAMDGVDGVAGVGEERPCMEYGGGGGGRGGGTKVSQETVAGIEQLVREAVTAVVPSVVPSVVPRVVPPVIPPVSSRQLPTTHLYGGVAPAVPSQLPMQRSGSLEGVELCAAPGGVAAQRCADARPRPHSARPFDYAHGRPQLKACVPPPSRDGWATDDGGDNDDDDELHGTYISSRKVQSVLNYQRKVAVVPGRKTAAAALALTATGRHRYADPAAAAAVTECDNRDSGYGGDRTSTSSASSYAPSEPAAAAAAAHGLVSRASSVESLGAALTHAGDRPVATSQLQAEPPADGRLGRISESLIPMSRPSNTGTW